MSIIVDIAATVLEFVAIFIASVLAIWAAGWLMMLSAAVYRRVSLAIESEHSLWYHAGRTSVWIQAAVRHPKTMLVALTVAEVASELNRVVDSIADDLSDERSGNPPPEAPPIQADNLRMPTTYPFKRVRTLSWPPFVGHRFALGDRSV